MSIMNSSYPDHYSGKYYLHDERRPEKAKSAGITRIVTKNVMGERTQIIVGKTRVIYIDADSKPSYECPLWGSDFEATGIVTAAPSPDLVIVSWVHAGPSKSLVPIKALAVHPDFKERSTRKDVKENPNYAFKRRKRK